MKIKLSLFVLLIPLTTTLTTSCLPLRGKTFFLPRSQGQNGARDLVGTPVLYDRQEPYYDHEIWGNITSTTMYQRSFKPPHIALSFFGTDKLRITGSQVESRGDNDLLADYFGLAPSFDSTVCLSPKISTFINDFSAYINLPGLWCGGYVEIHLPLVHTHWNMRLSETVTEAETVLPYPAGYMADGLLDAPLLSFKTAIESGATYGDVVEPIKFSRISCARTKTKLADAHLVVGADWMRKQRAHLGFNLRVVAPTGTRSTAEYLFEPVVGNGHHWEFGAGFTGHVVVWECERDESFAVHGALNVTHLFKGRNVRSFDFIKEAVDCSEYSNNPNFGSRYILLKEFDPATNGYTGRCVPAVNKTTFDVDIKAHAQIDLTWMFAYKNGGLGIDLGYNAWVRTRERITCDFNELFPDKTYALKGIQNVRTNAGVSNATQSTAMITGDTFTDQALVTDSRSPVLLSPRDLDIESAEHPGVFSHKLFTHIGYAFNHNCCDAWHPYIGFGGEIEFTNRRHRKRQADKISLPQWGIWAKAGVTY